MDDGTVMSEDGTEAATGHTPENAFVEEYREWEAVDPIPTQVLAPTQAARRTVLQYFSGVLAGLLVAWLIRVGVPVPDDIADLIGVLVGAAASWLAAKVMAIAKANAWLTPLGFGAFPKG